MDVGHPNPIRLRVAFTATEALTGAGSGPLLRDAVELGEGPPVPNQRAGVAGVYEDRPEWLEETLLIECVLND